MSALKWSIGAVATALLLPVLAVAQQAAEREYEKEGISAQTQDRDIHRNDAAQTRQPGQQYTAQFRGTQPGAQQEPLQRFLASCLLQKNKAEVDLGQLAQQQAQNPEVKEFAQRMVQDHQQLVQQLQPLAGTQGASTSATSQIDTQRQPSDTTRLPGSPGAGQPERDATQSLTAGRTQGQESPALSELAQIEKQITDRYFDAVREDLQQKQGAEFDKCYIGSQIGGHMHMLAALEVLQQQGPNELRQLAQQAQPKVQQHLEHAKQLMKQLEGAGPTSSQAERQPPRTQR
jgi:predicted outer membrane protein